MPHTGNGFRCVSLPALVRRSNLNRACRVALFTVQRLAYHQLQLDFQDTKSKKSEKPTRKVKMPIKKRFKKNYGKRREK